MVVYNTSSDELTSFARLSLLAVYGIMSYSSHSYVQGTSIIHVHDSYSYMYKAAAHQIVMLLSRH